MFVEDFALITLDIPYSNPNVHPLCLTLDPNMPSIKNKLIKVSGWGYNNETMKNANKFPDILQHATLKIKDPKNCFRKYFSTDFPSNWPEQKTKGFCAKGDNEQRTCQGDSGGAAIWEDSKDQNRKYLIGIISLDDGECGETTPTTPTIYAAISKKVADWLHKKINPDLECRLQIVIHFGKINKEIGPAIIECDYYQRK